MHFSWFDALRPPPLPKKATDNAVKDYHKRLEACVSANGGHFEHYNVTLHISDTNKQTNKLTKLTVIWCDLFFYEKKSDFVINWIELSKFEGFY